MIHFIINFLKNKKIIQTLINPTNTYKKHINYIKKYNPNQILTKIFLEFFKRVHSRSFVFIRVYSRSKLFKAFYRFLFNTKSKQIF